MTRPRLEVADVFRRHGPAWRAANEGHLSLAQRRVMSADRAVPHRGARRPRRALRRLRAHAGRLQLVPQPALPQVPVARRPRPGSRRARRSCCRSPTSTWSSPCRPALGAIAYQNKARVYGLLLKAAAEALTTIAADPKHLGARIGVTAVLHTWGQTLDHHPHVHCIVPAGGISLDGSRWVACRPGFFLPVRVLSRLFRRLFLDGLAEAHARGELEAFGDLAGLEGARRVQGPPGGRSGGGSGWSTPRPRSPGRSRCWATWPATRTGSRSRTAAWWRSTTTAR